MFLHVCTCNAISFLILAPIYANYIQYIYIKYKTVHLKFILRAYLIKYIS